MARYPSRVDGFRSQFEKDTADWLTRHGVAFDYELHVILYPKDDRMARYTPDFLLSNGIFIETKGRFMPADRQKHLMVREQYPDVDIRLLFMRSKQPISKGAKSTCADWCRKHNFTFADLVIPIEWIAR